MEIYENQIQAWFLFTNPAAIACQLNKGKNMKIYENQIQFQVSEKAWFLFISPAAIARYRDMWRVLVNAVMNLRFP